MKKIIFHHPLPLDVNATSASGIRPLKMIKAFEKLGYEVVVVTGYGKKRKEKIKNLKQRIMGGEKFEFVYSESSTQPTLLTEKNHLPIYPFLDFGFFNFCKNHNITVGLFYRDIYWFFPEHKASLSFLKRNTANFFYKYDLKKYNELVDIVYVPSMQMTKYIPIVNQNKFKALPPGHDDYESFVAKNITDKIELLYIGGLGSHYQMHKLFAIIKKFPKIHFTLCTRENEWQNTKSEYELSANISIVHKSGDELKGLYANADVAMLFVKPHEYWEFAAPVKLYEYIGKEKPIIASKGTLAGKFVEENNIGWTIEYEEKALEELFEKLLAEPTEMKLKQDKIAQIKIKHTWEARAKTVEKDLIV
ncbi:MAG: glycosyltransferase [Sulfurimonas sp.]|jgi:glycosyltransferase involved in cell wall biosynthesis